MSFSHEGTPRHSGRYPWGSGKDPHQRNKNFLAMVKDLRKQGVSQVDIAKGFGMNTAQLRAKISIANSELKKSSYAMAYKLKEKGYSNVAAAKRMGIPEPTFRSLLKPQIQENADITSNISEMLKKSVSEKKYIDVGLGVERHIGISRQRLKTAISLLEEEGYKIHRLKVEQLGTGKETSLMILAGPDSTTKEIFKNRDKIRMVTDYTEDGGRSVLGLKPINSISSKRLMINYAEDGGTAKDGVIELRRGVPDLSLGNAKYAQVRIGVDGMHYLKGMAMYADDLPKGVDIRFNTNKTKDTPLEKTLKSMETDIEGNIDKDNPFGAIVRQKTYIDSDGKEKLSALNIVNEEGDWGKWSKSISSQVLSKQTWALAKTQLGLAFDKKKAEFDEIMSFTNPIVKKKLLEGLADDADSASVHLKAASLPRQATHVILPFTDMKENEIYAPNYNNGERVVLIRYPHGGIFEIPELTVNNKHKGANETIKQARDAVGINSKVAEKLSGADFDGDTVLVIPNDKGLIKTAPSLKGLLNFDAKLQYKAYPGMPKMGENTMPKLMGDVSNLITDMTIKGATNDELARAVRHSMVVIDAKKHNLNYKQSAIDNRIAELKKIYQGKENAGAATLISRASSETRVPYREEGKWVEDPTTGKKKRMYVDPTTGEKLYEYTGKTYTKGKKIIDPLTGKKKTIYIDPNTNKPFEDLKVENTLSKSTKMAEAKDAFELSSGTPMETIYANHANKLKAMANEARKTALTIKPPLQSPTARVTYKKEVDELNAALNIAIRNKPLERQAHIIGNIVVKEKMAKYPDMEPGDLKKIKSQALMEARTRTKADKSIITLTERQWEAIQAHAVSANILKQILDNADMDVVRRLATPRKQEELTASVKTQIRRRIEAGYTQSEVANSLGLSTSTITKVMG